MHINNASNHGGSGKRNFYQGTQEEQEEEKKIVIDETQVQMSWHPINVEDIPVVKDIPRAA